MMFDEFTQQCRDIFRTGSRGLSMLAAAEHVSARDNAAAQMSQLLELAASMAVCKKVNRATFLAGCAEYYDNASDEPPNTANAG